MATTQYIGARYVPLFADPAEWNSTRTYEPLTIVMNEGNSYTSKQYVPKGIDISNEKFWALTGNYNAQVEAYRQEVKTFDGRIETNANNITAETTRAKAAEKTNANAIANIAYTSRKNDKVVIFSDSTFQTNPNPDTGETQKSVVSWMQELAPEMVIDNRGVGGTNTAWLLNLLNKMDADAISDASYVVVAYGTNDWQGSIEPLKVNKVSTDTFDYLYDACLNKISKLAPKANVLCVAPAFLKSTTASDEKILNQNNTGNTIQTYSDVIEFCAHNYNYATLRLDYLMGININNYTSRMVRSTTDIWVHYNEETNRRIATMLIDTIYGSAVSSMTSPCMDVTPNQWLCGDVADYYNLPDKSKFWTNSLEQSGLMPNTEYWITAYGGNCVLKCNAQTVLHSTNLQGIVQFKLMSDSDGKILLANENRANAIPLYNVRLTFGRPNIYNGVLPQQIATRSYVNSTQPLVTIGDDFGYGWLEFTDVAVLETNISIGTIPSPYKEISQGIFVGYYHKSTGYNGVFTGRVYNNEIYPNFTEELAEGVTAIINGILIFVRF